MIAFIIKLLGGGILGRVLDTIDKRMDGDAVKEQAKQETIREWARTQASMVNGPGRWLLALFVIPLGAWFAAVCIYSILWCKGCAFPQDWTIAALPPPLDQWSGAIVMSMFASGAGIEIARRLKR